MELSLQFFLMAHFLFLNSLTASFLQNFRSRKNRLSQTILDKLISVKGFRTNRILYEVANESQLSTQIIRINFSC